MGEEKEGDEMEDVGGRDGQTKVPHRPGFLFQTR